MTGRNPLEVEKYTIDFYPVNKGAHITLRLEDGNSQIINFEGVEYLERFNTTLKVLNSPPVYWDPTNKVLSAGFISVK